MYKVITNVQMRYKHVNVLQMGPKFSVYYKCASLLQMSNFITNVPSTCNRINFKFGSNFKRNMQDTVNIANVLQTRVVGTFVIDLLQMGRKFSVYYKCASLLQMCKFITNVPSTCNRINFNLVAISKATCKTPSTYTNSMCNCSFY